MANYRQIHTKLWSDPKFEPLPPGAKLLFCYLLTNTLRMSSGLYVITPKRMAIDTSIKLEEVEQALIELAEAGMVKYDDAKSVVWVVNALRYIQNTTQMRKSVLNDLCFNTSSSLVEEFLKYHSHVRGWSEFTEDVQFKLDSCTEKEELDDGEIPF